MNKTTWVEDFDKETWHTEVCNCEMDDECKENLKSSIASKLSHQREELLQKITPALDDFSKAANIMIEDGLLKATGQEIHENIGYIKSCFMADDIIKKVGKV